jgi:hypothetical protein
MNARSLGEILCFKFGWIPERGRSFLEVCAETDGKKLYDKEYWLDFEEWKKKICDIWDEYIRPELKRICRGEVEI